MVHIAPVNGLDDLPLKVVDVFVDLLDLADDGRDVFIDDCFVDVERGYVGA